ncbi:MAG TPA: cysteine hydrolase family protein [Opitutaceae bacterium]|nr:cysteine hydrolase family protein [Opitutaceae bacterium]
MQSIFSCHTINTLAAAAVAVGTALCAAAPATLLDLSGARWEPARLAEAALVIVDAQREYADGKLPLPDLDSAVQEIAELLRRARAAGTPVIHVVQQGRPGGAIMDPNGEMVEILAPLVPRAGETVIVKRLPNSFAGTDLEATLARTGRKHVIVVGFMTHMCVSATVRAALDHGYRCTVVAAACASRDLPDGHGGTVPAAEVHRVELAALGDRFAAVVADAAAIRD